MRVGGANFPYKFSQIERFYAKSIPDALWLAGHGTQSGWGNEITA